MPAYAIVAIVLLAGVYVFLTFEQTAIVTVTPAENAPIYQPLVTTTTVPTTTTAP